MTRYPLLDVSSPARTSLRDFVRVLAIASVMSVVGPRISHAALDCAASMPLDLFAGPISGDTTGKADSAQDYSCAHSSFGGPGPKNGFTGGEDVWDFTIAADSVVSFRFESTDPNLRLFLLSGCDELACLDEGGCGENLVAGDYRLVVDGLGGAVGPYTIEPVVLPVNDDNKWFDCPAECSGGCPHTAEQHALKKWQFNSGNYCGTGCDFALYAVVGCGTEAHFPFFDPETGHMRVTNVLDGQPMELVATNIVPANAPLDPACAWTDSGTLVEWEDSGCSAIPCPAGNCGGGSDCRTNNLLTDVQMVGSPNLCGVYRIDLENWGGWFWELVSNCTADRAEQFNIYRDLCSALAAYRPRPEVGISDLFFDDAECGNMRVSGEVTFENVGCSDASMIEIVIEQAPPLPANPSVHYVDVTPGTPTTLAWDYTLTATPAQLVVRVDPANLTDECSEDIGQTVPCGVSATLSREDTIDVCTNKCASFPDPGELKNICLGASCMLDGGGSEFRCTAGDKPEFRWEDIVGNPLPGCDWSRSPTCDAGSEILPLGKSRFLLRTRCGDITSECVSSQTTAVMVGGNEPPAAVGNALRLHRAGDDVVLSWPVSACLAASAMKAYSDTDPQLPVASRTPVGEAAVTDGFVTDPGAVGSGDARVFYQLVGLSCDGDIEGQY